MFQLIAQTQAWDYRMGIWLAVMILVAVILALAAIAVFAGRDKGEMAGTESHGEYPE